MPYWAESWDEMTARHNRERRATIEAILALRVSFAEAARLLGVEQAVLAESVGTLGIACPAWGLNAVSGDLLASGSRGAVL